MKILRAHPARFALLLAALASISPLAPARAERDNLDPASYGITESHAPDGAGRVRPRADAKPKMIASTDVDDAAGPAPAKPTTYSFDAFVDELAKNISLRQSFLSDDGESEPAKFSWTKAKGSDSFYTADLAVLLKPAFLEGSRKLGNGDYGLGWNIRPTFEAHVATEQDNQQNSLSYRLPVNLTLGPVAPELIRKSVVTLHFLTISPVFETDRLQNTETFGADLFYSLNVPDLAVGVKKKLFGPVKVLWRPYIGIEGGHVFDDGGNAALKDTKEYVRFSAKVHGEIWWTGHFVLTADYYFRNDLDGDRNAHSYVEVSPTIYLDPDKHISAGATYKRGKTTPQFTNVDSINLWLGAKF